LVSGGSATQLAVLELLELELELLELELLELELELEELLEPVVLASSPPPPQATSAAAAPPDMSHPSMRRRSCSRCSFNCRAIISRSYCSPWRWSWSSWRLEVMSVSYVRPGAVPRVGASYATGFAGECRRLSAVDTNGAACGEG